MNVANENQHWISRLLLKRFKIEGMPLQCYQLETDEWVEKGVERVCSGPGYNQLTVSGETDNTLEAAFSKIESGLRNSLRALEAAAGTQSTELPQAVYENICWYCSFLKGVAPYAKPGSVASFLIQLNMELETGTCSLIRDLDVPEDTIRELQRQHSMGRRIIVESHNLLQLLYRFQFARNYGLNFGQFLTTNWTVSYSPIELPMSDIGLVPMLLENHGANHYLLPLGPNLLFEGVFFHDLKRNSSASVVRGKNLTRDEAEYHFDCICASAVSELICARKLTGLAAARVRAKASGIRFCKIIDPEHIKSSGLIDVGEGDFLFRIVSAEEYKQVVHSYFHPWD